MKREDLVIIWLSVMGIACQFMWLRAERKAEYLAGRLSVFNEQAATSEDGTCFVAGGCEKTFPKPKNKGGHK